MRSRGLLRRIWPGCFRLRLVDGQGSGLRRAPLFLKKERPVRPKRIMIDENSDVTFNGGSGPGPWRAVFSGHSRDHACIGRAPQGRETTHNLRRRNPRIPLRFILGYSPCTPPGCASFGGCAAGFVVAEGGGDAFAFSDGEDTVLGGEGDGFFGAVGPVDFG